MAGFDGLGMHPGNLWRLSSAQSRSISPENFSGAPGQGGRATEGTGASCARDLGVGWKISPSIDIAAGETVTLAEISGPGAIQSIWITGTVTRDHPRQSIIRIYWDGQSEPSVEAPLGDFFAAGWGGFAQLTSLMVAVNPGSGFNCFWEMPFRGSCRITLENRHSESAVCYYQINYMLTNIPDDAAYFHAQFRRINPIPYGDIYTLLDNIVGQGQYVGTYLAVGVTNNGWWGEGEIKFFLDDDTEYPTICGTGTEDYFGGSYNWDVGGEYRTYTTPYLGMHQLLRPDGAYRSQQRFAMYRWHVVDPIRFTRSLRVTMQALGWRSGRRYLPLQCDMASVVYWYQTLPATVFPTLPSDDDLEII